MADFNCYICMFYNIYNIRLLKQNFIRNTPSTSALNKILFLRFIKSFSLITLNSSTAVQFEVVVSSLRFPEQRKLNATKRKLNSTRLEKLFSFKLDHINRKFKIEDSITKQWRCMYEKIQVYNIGALNFAEIDVIWYIYFNALIITESQSTKE